MTKAISAIKRLSYLRSQLLGSVRLSRSKSCPNCGASGSRLMSRKFVISELRLCSNCGINFRWPTDSIDTGDVVYQDAYSQPGLTTDLPGPELLEELKRSQFKGSEKDFSPYIAFLQSFFGDQLNHQKVLDYGANWGYFLFQLQLAGACNAHGYEISVPRRRFGEKALGVSYIDELSKTGENYDVIVSTHVIEHVPAPSVMLRDICLSLNKGGLLVLECPNGSLSAAAFEGWDSQWGRIHPYYISDSYLVKTLKELGFVGIIVDKPEFLSLSSLSSEEIRSQVDVCLCSRSPISSSLVVVAIKK